MFDLALNIEKHRQNSTKKRCGGLNRRQRLLSHSRSVLLRRVNAEADVGRAGVRADVLAGRHERGHHARELRRGGGRQEGHHQQVPRDALPRHASRIYRENKIKGRVSRD